ncbi:MAG: hypothetical protein R3336_01315 [Phycisphaeraceae bacterium]|nr:hypothetical protein [Phycisphaeraceae bacterium]
MNDVSTSSSCRLVVGYVRNVDYGHRPARKAGLDQRLAVIKPTRVHADADRSLDVHLLMDILQVMIDATEADHIVLNGHDDRAWRDLEELARTYMAQPASTREPVRNGELLRDGKIVGRVEIETHISAGKPEPYRGGWAIVLYASDVDPEAFAGGLRATGVDLDEPIQALQRPRVSLWRRLVDFIAYDPTNDSR